MVGFSAVLVAAVVVVLAAVAAVAVVRLWLGRRAAEERSRRFFELSHDLLAFAGFDGRLHAVNPAWQRTLGWTPAELTSRPFIEFVHPDDREATLAEYARANAEGGTVAEFINRYRTRDGSYRWLEWTATVRKEQEIAYAVARDITEVRRLQGELAQRAQLRESQRMEAVGRLVGGIAHDFNNLLTIMMASGELVAMSLRPDQARLREDVQALLDAGERGREMIRKLVGFSRRQPLELRAQEPGPLMASLTGTLTRLLPSNISVSAVVARDVPPLLADAGSLEQMIMNLATNARDAMPRGGELAIHVARADPRDAVLRRLGGEPGRFVHIAVRDSGTGMDEEVKRRIYEPFFTTKPPEQGTGLGMAMVYGLAKQQNGYVDVASAPGLGTTVSLYLPVAAPGERPAPAPPPPPEEADAAARGRGTILVADDEPVLLRAMERVLTMHGYRVLTATSGGEALAHLLAHRDELRLVITDQMMPGFSGADVYREARANGFTVPFLITSGYAPEELAGQGFGPHVPRLMKPWTAEELLKAVGSALRVPRAG